mmetsp:Transcript_10937/g.37939  ORF Transcript_10937/g.37939 Transcript_10937/m.37939 type:complete len:220 (-) Transcript_10937:140-799(-)
MRGQGEGAAGVCGGRAGGARRGGGGGRLGAVAVQGDAARQRRLRHRRRGRRVCVRARGAAQADADALQPGLRGGGPGGGGAAGAHQAGARGLRDPGGRLRALRGSRRDAGAPAEHGERRDEGGAGACRGRGAPSAEVCRQAQRPDGRVEAAAGSQGATGGAHLHRGALGRHVEAQGVRRGRRVGRAEEGIRRRDAGEPAAARRVRGARPGPRRSTLSTW